jgi:hypothetical protein
MSSEIAEEAIAIRSRIVSTICSFHECLAFGLTGSRKTLVSKDTGFIFESSETCAQPLTQFGQPISAKEYESNDSNEH